MLKNLCSVLAMAALLAVPALVSAQCTNCGTTTAVYSTPISGGMVSTQPMSYAPAYQVYSYPATYTVQPMMSGNCGTWTSAPVVMGCNPGCGQAVSSGCGQGCAPVMSSCGSCSSGCGRMVSTGCGLRRGTRSCNSACGCSSCCGRVVSPCCNTGCATGCGVVTSGCVGCATAPASGVISGDAAMPVEPVPAEGGVVSPSDSAVPPLPPQEDK